MRYSRYFESSIYSRLFCYYRGDVCVLDMSRLTISDPKALGPLPEKALVYLASLGATKVKISVKDGRSWIVTGINVWRGKRRVFIARVFSNAFVRGYLAPPVAELETLFADLRELAGEVGVDESGGDYAGEPEDT